MSIDREEHRLYNHPMSILLINVFLALSLLFSAFPAFAQPSSQSSDASKVTDNSVIENDSGTETPATEIKAEKVEPLTIEEGLSAGGKKVIKAIEVKGNRTISLSTILAKIKSRVGQEYLQGIISDDIKRLYNTGYFSDVHVDKDSYEGGYKVFFFVTEKPIVEEITFSKLRYYNWQGLLRKLKTKQGKFLDNKSLNDDIRTIVELYSKKGLTQAVVNVEKNLDELTNKVNLHFVINEGERVRIKKIKVEGNITFRYKKILHVIKARAKSLFNGGYLKEETLEEDMERIKSFYEKEGFIDATATYEYDHINPRYVIVRIHIQEGKRYYVEDITVSGNKVLTKEEIINAMKEVKTGGIFSREKLTVDLSNIRSVYFDKGYIFATIKDSTSLNPKDGRVEIRLDVQEGELAYINKIKIQGNDRTRDIVIRRELRLYPGDQFDGSKWRRSKERLRNLGYFEDISYDFEDTELPNTKNLIVQVKEAKTGSLSFGGGYSTIDQLVGFIEVEQKNFDFTNWPTFTGGGQQVSLRAEAGSTRYNTRLSFTEPWLFDHPISGGFDAYQTQRDRERDVGFAFDENRTGGDMRFGKQFTEYVSGDITYRRENIKIDNFEDGVSADFLAEEGKNTVSSISVSLGRDTRDSVFNPTRGLFISGTPEVAGGALGGDKDYYRFTTRGSYYVPL